MTDDWYTGDEEEPEEPGGVAERARLASIRPKPEPDTDGEDADEIAAIHFEPGDFDGGYGYDSYFSRAMRKDD